MRRGFSLLEVVMVLIAVGFAAAIAAPRFANANARYHCDAAANRIAADLKYFQATSRASGVLHTITFDPVNMAYQVSSLNSLDNTSTTYNVSLTNEPYRATITSIALGNGGSANSTTLSFDPYGAPSSSGSIVIAAGSFSHTISVDGSSGAITVQ